jgi:hypothetical protein
MDARSPQDQDVDLRALMRRRWDSDVHLRLVGPVEVDGRVKTVGHDFLIIDTASHTTMIVPFTAIQFVRETRGEADSAPEA